MDEGMEEGEITESEPEMEENDQQDKIDERVKWPPGKWRLGTPFENRKQKLFMRFATKGECFTWPLPY